MEILPMSRILPNKIVLKRIGKHRTTIYRWIKAGKFPPPVEIGPNRIGWFEDEIEDWLSSRPRRTYGAPSEEAA